MKLLLRWFWHGEDVGRRLLLATVSVANVATALGSWPVTQLERLQVAAQLALAALTGAMSKPADEHRHEEPK